MGLTHPTYAREREFIALMRRLWKGETITQYEGALGHYPVLSMPAYLDEDIPILYVGFGFKSLEHAGTCYDGTHLHTFMSDAARVMQLKRCVEVRQVLVERLGPLRIGRC